MRVDHCLVIDPQPKTCPSQLDQVGKLIGSGVDIYSILIHWSWRCVSIDGDWEGGAKGDERERREKGKDPELRGEEKDKDPELWGRKRMEPEASTPSWLCSISSRITSCIWFYGIFGTTHPNSASDSTMTHTACEQYPPLMWVSHCIKPYFPFISYIFPMMSHCVLFYYSFSLWFIIWFIIALTNAVMSRTFWNILSDSLLRNLLIDLNNCYLVIHGLPPVYKRLVLPQRKDI